MLSQYQHVIKKGFQNYEQKLLNIAHLEKCIDLYKKSKMKS